MKTAKMARHLGAWMGALLGLALGPAAAQPPQVQARGLDIELNKLEPLAESCRAYLLFRNRTEHDFRDFQLELVLFDTDGVISGRLAVDVAPLRPGKTTVRLFDIPDQQCAAIGQILVNDVPVCASPTGERDDCIDLLDASSRTTAGFTL